MPQVELTWGAATAVGQREDNQDRFLAAPPVFAVADGMGGHVGGAAAAEAVVEALRSLTAGETTTVESIRLALQRADGEIRAFEGPDKAGAGTTVAGVALVDEGAELDVLGAVPVPAVGSVQAAGSRQRREPTTAPRREERIATHSPSGAVDGGSRDVRPAGVSPTFYAQPTSSSPRGVLSSIRVVERGCRRSS